LAQLQSRITNSIPIKKNTAVKPCKVEKQLKEITTSRETKLKSSKIQKKLAQYDMSMKQNIKRYTPVGHQNKNTIEVHHLNSLHMPSTARHLCSSSNSKGSIGESTSNSKFWNSHHTRHMRSKFGHKTVTEEATRETSCNKDSNAFLGSFELLSFKDRILVQNESQKLDVVKGQVEKTLNTYRSYCSNLQQEMHKLKRENQRLKNILSTSK